MKTNDLVMLGIPRGGAARAAHDFIANFVLKGGDSTRIKAELQAIADHPEDYLQDPLRSHLANILSAKPDLPRTEPVAWQEWGQDLDETSRNQLKNACQLPISVKGALMPDAHVGYGLPIGGVLATDAAVIPYAVGVDIACRMKMTVLDLPFKSLLNGRDKLGKAIESETKFGIGAHFKRRRQHDVLDADWSVSPITQQNKDKAWSQLGTSGSGNHFVEFGSFTAHEAIGAIEPGKYVALLSHSGSRGTGAKVCAHYSKLAADQHRHLPKELQRLAWLDLNSQEGEEYWQAMELMGQYAAANHAMIHQHISEHLGVDVLLDLENHHNFAWKERHVIAGVEREVIVHRKGATPAGAGVLGIIPGSMASPGFVVRGKGNPDSLASCSHGAGRLMSRKKANSTFRWQKVNQHLKEKDVTLLSAGLDEVPMAYKDIHQVMEAQQDLVEIIGKFDPKIVKMAPHGERPED